MIKGDIIYYARVLEKVYMYEVYELKVRMVEDTWFSATDKNTKQAFLFSHKDIGKTIFFDRKEALKIVKNAEKNKKEINREIYYEEF